MESTTIPKEQTDLKSLISAARAVVSECPYLIANLANVSALIREYVGDIN